MSFKHANGENESKDIPYENGEPVGEIINELVPKKKVNNEESTIGVGESSQGTTSKVFIGWNGYKVTADKTNPDSIDYSSEEFTGFADKNTLINEATDMIPVYAVPNITLESDLEESPAKITISQTGMVTLDASVSEENKGYIFTGWEKDGERFVDETVYTLSPEDLREEHTYTACYDVVITYKIPVVNEDGTIGEGYNGITDIVSYGQALNGNYSIQAINAAKEAFDKTADKAFTGKWSTEENGTSVYVGTEGITKPLSLYPISTEAVKITYKIPKVNENGEAIVDENGKPTGYDNFTTNIPLGLALKDGYDDEAKLLVETRMSKGEYMFSGDWTTKEGSEEVYDRTAAITESITLYPILKEAVTITYKIPAADNTGKAVIGDDGTSTNGYDDFQVRIPKGETISDTYDKEASLEVAEVLEDTGWVFTGDWTATEGSEEVYKDATNENKTLYPILKHGKYIPVYFNMSDTVYSIGMVNDEVNGGFIFPKETVLLTTTNASTRGATSIDGRVVSAQFVGYSLVTIDSNGNRTSEKLYKAGETLSQTNLDSYDDDTHRIYAVWTQIQNISGASIYQNKDGSQDGLFTAAAVNTKILANAGLQNSEGASYDRHILYSKDSKYLIVNTDKVTWNNTLYKQYFDKDFVPDENWSIYTSYLYNISSPLDQYGVCPYLSFNYKNDNGANGVGNFRDEDNQTVEYTLEGVAKELLSLNEEVQKSYSWYNYIDLIKDYARGGETN
ncbi:MAG TPA: hypothetical protein IAC96_14055 [Candidatus Fimimorpha faecalis]|uniref:Uncharacterized protein n=1 Tax=Candidatus Fimimorpha faecalis TaxID=2840824 RepID=A0A9D1EHJ1_9FIRM|nr:hypothetical protein [Candidatus Fimimorpha faecalis]